RARPREIAPGQPRPGRGRRVSFRPMATRRDPFANFDRMRREIDDLFGALWQRSPLTQRQASGFSPRVDVYYCGDPPKAVVKVDLSGVALDAISLEISGRTMV